VETNMPSKQTNKDVFAIEELVNEIKLNLRLKAAPTTAVAAPISEKQQNSLIPSQIFQSALQPSHDQLFLQNSQSLHAHPQQQQNVIKKQRSRPSPYHIPCRSWSEPVLNQNGVVFGQNKKLITKINKNDENNIEDPYELLQTLIKSNNLVKEAVRRLHSSSYSRKQRYFYDSDEETNRSPSIVMMCQLES
jgi:hypothetical protein